MPSTESGKSSPRRALSKLRRTKGPSVSTNSLANGSGDSEDNAENGGLRASMDIAIDKFKERTKRNEDSRRNSKDEGTSRLRSLLPRSKRGSRQEDDGLERRLSALSGEASNSSPALFISGNRSDASLPDDSGHSSLMTDDNSDTERKPLRPTLSPHQSHAGYLTLSSPELHAQTQSVTTANNPPFDTPADVLQPTTSIPHINEPTDTEPFPTISPVSTIDRNPSAAEKLKGAFRLPRKQPLGNIESVKSAGSGAGGLGNLFRPKSRRGSIASQASSEPIKGDEATSVGDPDISVPNLHARLEAVAAQKENSEERPKTAQQQVRGRSRINTNSLPATPPNLVDTPTTLVTPPTPTDLSAEFPRSAVTSDPDQPSSPGRPLSSVESIRHRRAQSAKLPSKLSNAIALPLTPTVEEAKTPGGTLTQPTSATGFFSSFITAANKAADQLQQNINTINKNKADSQQPAEQEVGEEIVPEARSLDTRKESVRRAPAVDTLGEGDLSLSHLGIAESTSPMSSTITLPQQDTTAHNVSSSQKVEEEAAARAVSVAYEKPVQTVISQAAGRPISVASNDRLTLNGEQSQSPPRSGNEIDSIKRSGSVRSKLSGRTRRHRASSATTGTVNTIAAGIQSSAAGFASPGIHGAGHRLTGFAVASSKRNKDFHQLFRSVPEDDYLIEDYSAALQKDILLHGRLYVSEGHVCFSSNILGWVTNLVIGFDEIACVEKKSTAMIFPNAIVIQTLQARNTFASFVARDSTYELIIGIWKISHPNLKSSLNGVALDDAGTGDKTEVANPEAFEEDSADGSDDEVYDEDEDDDVGSFTDAGTMLSAAGSEAGDVPLSRKTSAQPVNSIVQTNGVQVKGLESVEAVVAGAVASADFPGPTTHASTECADVPDHYDRPLTDIIIAAPLGKVYSLMYGPASGAFMRKWLIDDQKSRELNMIDDKIGLDNEHRTMTFDYIKPLNAPVGPRQTKCITTVNLIAFDLEKAVTIDCSTATPDVPSGSVFTTKTRYCLMWGPGNTTRVIVNCTIEWTGKSWLKGPIEKGANDGQTEYVRSITAALKAAVTTKPVVVVAKGTAKKGKRRSKKDISDVDAALAQRDAVIAVAEQKAASWGLLEPLHQILEPFAALLRPFITSQVIIAVLVVLLLYTWLVPPHRGGSGVGMPGYGRPERVAAYEEIWRQEESELWDWLEDRVGLDHLYAPSDEQRERQRVLGAKGMGKRLADERMGQRQVDDAIRTTEERLAMLKEGVARKKAGKQSPKREEA
ncbi:hypothetical protein LTR48_004392 [Friedmanniomyces endolithicus]|uniref:VASt domain-containing protein n=1 Tax=Rachicladosporium monterosium TaxID=1507873 RepID=A0ABR0KY22_9PEZI|nr:hypothetical protein LTR48_004392 [Friedmanniomyces endolithicus]KAK5140473.1 hypothetical protein LTR32_006737 [Rachicladosporium monterosium]